MGLTEKYIIRTSDRIQFKKCRRAWDIGSKIRQNLEPIKVRTPLEFGTAFHAAMEVYYDPDTWSWLKDDRAVVVRELARKAFHDTCTEQFRMHEKTFPDGTLPDELRDEFKERRALGDGMLDYFFTWAETRDRLTPLHREIEFEVPILFPHWLAPWTLVELERRGFSDIDGYLYYKGKPVVYQGRIDLIAQDDQGKIWIVDHKTAANLQPTTEFLELDEQMGSYAWAAEIMLGIDIWGVLYSEHRKAYPQPPKILERPYRSRWISTNKQQATTVEMFMEALEETGESPDLYEDYLHYLREEGLQYIRREWVHRSPVELENLGRQISLEAIEMLSEPFIYPSPDKFSCKWCDHRTLCLAMNDGSDIEWIKSHHYYNRQELKQAQTQTEEKNGI